MRAVSAAHEIIVTQHHAGVGDDGFLADARAQGLMNFPSFIIRFPGSSNFRMRNMRRQHSCCCGRRLNIAYTVDVIERACSGTTCTFRSTAAFGHGCDCGEPTNCTGCRYI